MIAARHTALLLAFALVAACSDPNEIPRASIPNAIDTVTLWTLSKGPLSSPTAFSVNTGTGVRTWEVGSGFEFAYDVDQAGRSVFLPLDVLGLANPNALRPGLKRSTLPFDEMRKAPLNGYVSRDTVPVVEGDRLFVRTSVNTCAIYGVPLYAKLEVLDIDTAASTITFRVLSNQNCGYRGLNLGIPKS
jgi:hypothetical protein